MEDYLKKKEKNQHDKHIKPIRKCNTEYYDVYSIGKCFAVEVNVFILVSQVTQCSTFYKRLKINTARLIHLQDLLRTLWKSLEAVFWRWDISKSIILRVLLSVFKVSSTEVAIDWSCVLKSAFHLLYICKHLRKLVVDLPFKVDEECFVAMSFKIEGLERIT